MQNASQSVRVARIGKPHGIRGEVTVEIFTDSPESRFQAGQVLSVQTGTEGSVSPLFPIVTVESSRWNNKILLLKFSEFSDRNTAESLRGSVLYASVEDTLKDNSGWYAQELVGLPVHVGSLESPSIGIVSTLNIREMQDLLEIRLSDGRDVLIPFVEEIVPIVDENQGIVITPPPGLLELNQE